jgi:hypothetical protein
MSKLEVGLAQLPVMPPAELREMWQKVTGSAVPRVSPSLLRLALGYQLQAKAYGDLSRQTRQTLDQLAAAKTQTRAAQPGMRLAREWNGTLHVVMVGEDKVIRWKGREWRSLSEIARAITGSHWSGPAFFGLKRRIAA